MSSLAFPQNDRCAQIVVCVNTHIHIRMHVHDDDKTVNHYFKIIRLEMCTHYVTSCVMLETYTYTTVHVLQYCTRKILCVCASKREEQQLMQHSIIIENSQNPITLYRIKAERSASKQQS